MATRMIHEAASRWLGRTPFWTGTYLLPDVDLAPGSPAQILGQVVDLDGDDARVRELAERPASERAAGFEALRRGYALRREFGACQVPRAKLGVQVRDFVDAAGFG